MATDNQIDKSLISGGNAEVLKAETTTTEQATADVLYGDKDKEAANAEQKNDSAANEQADTQQGDQNNEQKNEGEEQADANANKKDGETQDDANKDAETEEHKAVDLTDMTMPEGFEMNDEVMSDLTKVINDRKLDKETAEALAPIGAKIAENAINQINSSYADIRAGWRDQVANDAVLGNREAMSIADKGLEAYGSAALRELADKTGLGDHPEFIRAFYKIGLTVKEDDFVRGGSGDQINKSAAETMYPTMK